jgi:hypothetical protein
MRKQLAGIAVVFAATWGAADAPSVPTHLADAETLVANIRPADNEYLHRGCYIHWPGIDGATEYGLHSDCSDFVALLLEHSYHFTPRQMRALTGKERPLANTWHDAIEAGRGGLSEVKTVSEVRPGNILAIRYPPGEADTGHVMLVDGPPVRREPSAPVEPGTVQWDVTVIDSSKSGHGPTDTRHRHADGTSDTGVGRGVVRLYSNPDGTVAGYSWSDSAKSEFRAQSDRHLIIGRLDPAGA